ncbi:MAG: hypothetical protein KZQ88_08560 [Candidatus Thiodiazotropha sp. (ex Dulcina madagascariensis)]|nr:hypothetical protein [Candidatus Thiodiazotropha sp. (ex Dulcina madagascariensis)]MCU7926236.1 hypothetical protein [Candidatus Thiodiazotropha sp. (ex Dulcina madagascariensis)]
MNRRKESFYEKEMVGNSVDYADFRPIYRGSFGLKGFDYVGNEFPQDFVEAKKWLKDDPTGSGWRHRGP